MANASKKSMGAGTQGKRDGSGAMTSVPDGALPENMVLSNRDKSRHSDDRGLDSRQVQTEQYRDHVGARRTDQEPTTLEGNTSGLAGQKSDSSAELGSREAPRRR